MSNELYHYGVKGMKWGVRRYQPYGSGGYSPKGGHDRGMTQNRQFFSDRRNTPEWNRRTIKNDDNRRSPAEVVTKETEKSIRRAADIVRRSKKYSKDAKKLSDKELQKAIRRLRLENEYNQLNVDNGRAALSDILDSIGDVAAITASVATAAAAVYYMRNH